MTNELSTPVLPKTAETSPRDYASLGFFSLFFLLLGNSLYHGMQLAFAVSGIGALLTLLCYLPKPRCAVMTVASLASSLAIFASFALYENSSCAFYKLNALFLLLPLFIVSGYGVKAPSLDDFRALLSPYYLFFGENIRALPFTARSLGKKNASAGKTVAKILLAIAFSMPLLTVLTLLLVSADPAFEEFVNRFDLDVGEFIFTVMVALTVFFCTFPLLFAIRKQELRMQESAHKPYLSVLDNIITCTVLSLVTLLYTVFLATQLSYLIGGFAGLLPEDFTYADYARRGFFEMAVLCAINLGVIFLAEVFAKRGEDGRVPTAVRILNLCISLFSLFLIGSAFAKMFLYIRTYGLTFLRLGTSIYMALLFVVFVSLVLRTFLPRFPVMRTALVTLCLLMGTFALCEPYKIIVDYNMYRYEQTQTLDIYYIAYDCGTYGVEPLIAIASDETADEGLRDTAKERLLSWKLHHIAFRTGGVDLRAESLSRHRAAKALAEYKYDAK